MSVPNHHQQNPKRALSPPGPPPRRKQATPASSASAPTTKSPHTDKIIKKSRTDGAYSPHPAPNTTDTHPVNPTPQTPASAGNHCPTTNVGLAVPEYTPRQYWLIHLNTQLSTLEQTVSKLKNYSPPDSDSEAPCTKMMLVRTTGILNLVKNYLKHETSQDEIPTSSVKPPPDPPNPLPPTTTSYADTVKATLPTPARGHPAQTTHRPKQADKTAAPSTHRGHPARVIIDFLHCDFQIHQGNEPKATPLTLRTTINNILLQANIAASVSAVTITKTGNVILTPTAPNTASQFVSGMASIIIPSAICAACGVDVTDSDLTRVSVYEDTPWHRVVIHGIPKETNGSQEDWMEGELYQELKTYNPSFRWSLVGPKLGRDYRVLCRKDDWSKKEAVSLCFAFRDGAMARLAIRNGLAAFGAQCRVSPYRPLSKAQTSTTAAC